MSAITRLPKPEVDTPIYAELLAERDASFYVVVRSGPVRKRRWWWRFR